MKANYTKPLLAVEMFSLTQSVARDCADNIPRNQLTQSDLNTCFWDMGGGAKVFIAEQHCSIDGVNMSVICYNNPSEGNYVFHS